MDKSALKDKRRETVIGLLKGMNIKKDSDGGFDRDDVYGCIQELCNLYEEHIDELIDTINSLENEEGYVGIKERFDEFMQIRESE